MRTNKEFKSELLTTTLIWGTMFFYFLIALIIEITPISAAVIGCSYGLSLTVWLVDVFNKYKKSP